MHRTFVGANWNADDPLSVRWYRKWHDSLATRHDSLVRGELYSVARTLGVKPGQNSPVAREIAHTRAISAEDVSPREISRAWGTPKPTLANSYRSELLNLKTFPTLMGYSSRIMAESWESNTLYWAALADEVGVSPTQLNVRIPEWTRKLVEQIFASHLEDWPALLRSLRLVGDDVREKARRQTQASNAEVIAR